MAYYGNSDFRDRAFILAYIRFPSKIIKVEGELRREGCGYGVRAGYPVCFKLGFKAKDALNESYDKFEVVSYDKTSFVLKNPFFSNENIEYSDLTVFYEIERDVMDE
ncbi:MAG: hypothetical protein ACJASQ_001657 [Crocinitomicaceae bacterium]|jgi:hypothetical protein